MPEGKCHKSFVKTNEPYVCPNHFEQPFHWTDLMWSIPTSTICTLASAPMLAYALNSQSKIFLGNFRNYTNVKDTLKNFDFFSFLEAKSELHSPLV